MILNNRRIRNAVAGGAGAFVSWLFFIEPLIAPRLGHFGGVTSALLFTDALFGALAGAGIGLALGAVEGLVDRSWRRAGRDGLTTAAIGLVGGAVGLVVAELVYQPLAFLCFIGRAVGWGVFGAILGLAAGVTRRSWRGARNAALGGLIGGAVGGFMFDLVGAVVVTISGQDGLSRGVALTILGACLGFWIAALERALAPALLKIISGRMEGKEYVLDKPLLNVGSAEQADVAIYGDPALLPRHATLHWQNEVYVLQAAAGAVVTINGQPVQRQALQPEDQLVFGRTRAIFRQKEKQPGARPVSPRPGLPVAPVASATGQVVHLVDVQSGRRIALSADVIRIGREADNDFVLDDPSVSGHHALVQRQNAQFVIHDQGSRNGVYVNGRLINGPNLIRPGWQVQLGDRVLRVE